jgi:hypothetical protein
MFHDCPSDKELISLTEALATGKFDKTAATA